VLDVWVDGVVKRLGGAPKKDAKVEVLRATATENSDVNSALQEIVVLTFASTELAVAGDVQAQVENISAGTRIVNDLDIR
jgi:hypothetical protein